jgi:dephospho-CoA kinase
MTLTVGLTGGIGSGKSAVAGRLAALGAAVVDTDEISRELTAAGGAAMQAIHAAFDGRYLAADGGLDRAAMRAAAFQDREVRARLEAVLHPAIRGEADRRLARAAGPYAVIVVPLLFETRGYAGRVDRILVVDCAEALQVERASRRPGLDAAQVRAIMRAQWPRWRRLQLADDVIWNGGGLAALDARCAELHARYAGGAR